MCRKVFNQRIKRNTNNTHDLAFVDRAFLNTKKDNRFISIIMPTVLISHCSTGACPAQPIVFFRGIDETECYNSSFQETVLSLPGLNRAPTRAPLLKELANSQAKSATIILGLARPDNLNGVSEADGDTEL